jgi:hypothetical protein
MEYGLLASKSADFLKELTSSLDVIPYGKLIAGVLVIALLVYFFVFRSR